MAVEKRKESISDDASQASDAEPQRKKMEKPDFSDHHETVTVIVGKKEQQKPFTVYTDFLVYYSTYFEKALNGPWTEATTRTITLDHTEPEAFGLFVSWIYTQTFRVVQGPDQNTEPCYKKRISLDKPSAGALIELWVLADYLGIPKLQNYIIPILWNKMKRINAPFPEEYGRLYEKTSIGSPLRKLFVDHARAGYNTKYILDYHDYIPKEFLFDIWASHNAHTLKEVTWNGFTATNYYVKEDETSDEEMPDAKPGA